MVNLPPRNPYGQYQSPYRTLRVHGSPKSMAGAVVAWVCAFVTIAVMAIVWGPIHDLIYNYLPAIGLVTGTSASAGILLTAFDVFMVMMAIGTILAALVNSVS
jgi:uncharacterized membrane protein YagU involved in acid resistance